MADALYGTATFVDAAAAIVGAGTSSRKIRSHQTIRVGKREQHVADYCATQPGTPQPLRIRVVTRWWRLSVVRGCTSAPTHQTVYRGEQIQR